MPEPQRLGRDTHKKRMVKPMRLIRSGALWRISNTAALSQLSAVFDMRSENERSFHPDPAFPGADYIHIQVSESGRRKFTQANVLLKIRWTIYLPVTTVVSKAQAKG